MLVLIFEARSRTVCQVLGYIVVPPVAFKLAVIGGSKSLQKLPAFSQAIRGIKSKGISRKTTIQMEQGRIRNAELALGKNLIPTKEKAVIKAHNIGKGLPGKDGTPARLGNYTRAQLRQKANILREAGFSKKEIRNLMENGIVGLSAAENSFLARIFAMFPALRLHGKSEKDEKFQATSCFFN